MPPDVMPCARDWITCWESMITAGIDLGREPISVNVPYSRPVFKASGVRLLC